MGSQDQNRLNIDEQKTTLKNFIEIDSFFNLYISINLKYIFQYFRPAAPYQEPWTKSCVNFFLFVYWGFIVEWIQYLTYLSFCLRQGLIWNPCNSFLWCFILALYLQFHKCATRVKFISTQCALQYNKNVVSL